MMNFNRLLFISILFISSNVIADDGKISSRVYFEYNYQTEDDEANGNEFEVRRAYLTYERRTTDVLKFKFTADVGHLKEDDTNNGLYLFLKNALVSWKTGYGELIAGVQGMNVFSVQEKNWGYRVIEKSVMDKNKYSSSAGLGLGYANKISKNIYFSYLVTNGGGYSKDETDSHKKQSLLVAYGERKLSSNDGFNLGAIFTYEPYEGKDNNKTIAGVFSGYAGHNIRIGAEVNTRYDTGKEEREYLSSIYGALSLPKLAQSLKVDETTKFELFCRVDHLSKEEDENHLIAGVIYWPSKSFNIAPNYRHTWGKSTLQNYKINFQFQF